MAENCFCRHGQDPNHRKGDLRLDLREAALKPADGRSDRHRPTLIRRLSLDLVGLPPIPEEVDAFAADTAPQKAIRAL